MIYVMSDIHGDFEKYEKMLQKIKFRDADLLYILGDVIDRGKNSIKILSDMMMRSNVIPVLGNHEYAACVCLPKLLEEITDESIASLEEEDYRNLIEWSNIGGNTTIKELVKIPKEEREYILEYLEEFSLYEEVEVNGREFVLVHAGLEHFSPERPLDDYDLSELIFETPDYDKVYFEKKYLVTGHLPTRVIFARDQGLLLEEVPKEKYSDQIFQKNRHIAIDCGCSYGGKLGCLCLDTLEEFYV